MVNKKIQNPKSQIQNLREKIQGKVVILGVGNVMKKDDGAGPELVKRLNGRLKATLLNCGSAPENYTSIIRDKRPNTLLIIDAVDFGGRPGSFKMIDPKNIRNETISTHNVSIKVFADFIRNETRANVFVIGIQPKEVGFGTGLSNEIQEGLKILEEYLVEAL